MKNLLSVLLLTLSMQVSANTIEGAFGLKLGEVVPQGFKFNNDSFNWFKFNPKKPLPGYDKYTFRVSPIGKKVVSIFAKGKDVNGCFKFRWISDLFAYLESKYGKLDFEQSGEYVFKSKGRQVSLSCVKSISSLGYRDFNEEGKAESEEKKIVLEKYSNFNL